MAELPGVRSKVGLGGSGEKYQLVLTGEDPQALATAAAAVEKDLRTISGLGSITSSASLIRSEIAVRPDFARAADLGVTSSAIGETLRIATVGDYDTALAKLNLSQRQVPIVVKLDSNARQDLDLLGRLVVPGVKGPVMLSQVATLEVTGGPAVIDRLNRSRNIQLRGRVVERPAGRRDGRRGQMPSLQNLPAGVQAAHAGRRRNDGRAVRQLWRGHVDRGDLCMSIVLVLLFKDFLTLHHLAALPLSLGGAFVMRC